MKATIERAQRTRRQKKTLLCASVLKTGAMVALLASASCMAFREAEDRILRNKNLIKQHNDGLQAELEENKDKSRQIVRYENAIWIGDTARAFRNSTRPLPSKILDQRQVTLVTALPVDLQTAAYKIKEVTGLKVYVEQERTQAASIAVSPPSHKILYDGDLRGLLNAVAHAFDAHWIYDGGEDTITFTRFITKTFDFYAPPNTISTSAAVSSGGGGGGGDGAAADGGDGGGGGGGSASISFDQSASLNEWEDIQAAIQNLLPANSNISLSPSIGKITVTTTPAVMRKVAAIIKERNDYFTEQIHLGVQIIEFTLNSEDNYGLNLENLNAAEIIMKIFDLSGIGLTSFSLATGALIEGGTAANTITYQGSGQGTDAGGTRDSFISALSTYGNVGILTTADTRTRNGKPTPIQSTQTRAYLASVQTTVQGDQAGTQVTNYTPGEVTTGIFMTLRPRILDRERVQVDISLNIDTFLSIESFGTGENAVQQPETATQSFMQETIIPNGHTFIMAGFERKTDRTDRRGTGHPDNIILGGQRFGRTERSMVIILVTPTIIKS